MVGGRGGEAPPNIPRSNRHGFVNPVHLGLIDKEGRSPGGGGGGKPGSFFKVW